LELNWGARGGLYIRNCLQEENGLEEKLPIIEESSIQSYIFGTIYRRTVKIETLFLHTAKLVFLFFNLSSVRWGHAIVNWDFVLLLFPVANLFCNLLYVVLICILTQKQ
jgi:hypothetical protein